MAQKWDYDDKKGWTQESYLDKVSRVWITGEDSIFNRGKRWLKTQQERPNSKFEQNLVDASNWFYEKSMVGPTEDHAIEQTTKGVTNLAKGFGVSEIGAQVAGHSAGFLVGIVSPFGPGEAKALVNLNKARKLSKTRNVLTISDEYKAIPRGTKITNKMLDEQLLIRKEVDDLIAKHGGIDKVPKHKLDKLYSRKSTTTEILPNDIEFYNQNKAFKDKYVQYEDSVNKLGTLEWHHKNMKAVSAPFLDRAWEIVRANGGTQADILNLHQMALNHGVGMGDRMSALLPMGRVPHQKLHNWAKATGIQLNPKQIKELTEQLKGVDNMEDLTKLFNKSLEEIAEPMAREAKIMEAVWQDLSPLKRSQLADLYQKRDKVIRSITKAKKKGSSTVALEKQKKLLDKQYYAVKDPLVEEFFENRPKYGDYTDEYGVLKPEGSALTPGYEGRTTGFAERDLDLKIERQLRRES
tara:strand:- start:49 stop:1446 length:1398 start_codon:yes stop_codon:yes gene_type:complete